LSRPGRPGRDNERIPNHFNEASLIRAGSNSGERRRTQRLGRRPGRDIGLAVERRDQTVDAVVGQDGGEFGTAGRRFANRAVEAGGGNQLAVATAAHHIVDLHALAVAFGDLASHYESRRRGLLAGHLELGRS